jgi:drug/metabolite transporter (DMT)-like permease
VTEPESQPSQQGGGKATPWVYIGLLAAMCLWGGAFAAGRAVVQDIGPISASFLRYFFASLFLFGYGWFVEPAMFRPTWRQLGMYAVLGVTGVLCYNVLFLKGLESVKAGRAAVIVATNPAITAVLASMFLGERFTLRTGLGVAISLFGALIVITGGDPLALVHGAAFGDLVLMTGVAFFVVFSLYGKVALRSVTPLAAVAWSSLLGDVFLLGPALGEGLIGYVAQAGSVAWLLLLYLAFLGTGVGFILYYEGIRVLGAGRASAFINLVPISAALVGYFFLGEILGVATLAGGALVIAGVYLTNRTARPGQVPLPSMDDTDGQKAT